MAQYPQQAPTNKMPCASCPIKTCCGSDVAAAARSAAVAAATPAPAAVVAMPVSGCCDKCVYAGALENKKPPTICDCHDGKKIRVCPENMPLPKRWNFYSDEPLSPKDVTGPHMHHEPAPSRTGGSDVDPCCALVCPPPKPGCCPQFPPAARSCGGN